MSDNPAEGAIPVADPTFATSRHDLIRRLAEAVPAAGGVDAEAVDWSLIPRGGRSAAVEQLSTLDPVAYGRSRNHVSGAVSRLSPWIRHGVLSLTEVRDRALTLAPTPEAAEPFVAELGWRDYWRQVQAALGDRLEADIEPPALPPRSPARIGSMPQDVLAARTGMRCIDDFVRRLHGSGWLHNHERMWLASWLVHVRGVDWRAGADWFLHHLLDGDPASNHLSWQWVAGTFSAKPYLFNRENLERFTAGVHCRPCPLLGRCDVEGTYEALTERLFVAGIPPARQPLRIPPAAAWRCGATGRPRRPLVWLGLDSAAVTSPAVVAFPDSPRVFVIDRDWLDRERPGLKRLVFLCECLAEVPGVEVRVGTPAELLPSHAAAVGCDGIAMADTPCPRVRRAAELIGTKLPVTVCGWPEFCDRRGVRDLGRFSRYWQRVSGSALRPTGG